MNKSNLKPSFSISAQANDILNTLVQKKKNNRSFWVNKAIINFEINKKSLIAETLKFHQNMVCILGEEWNTIDEAERLAQKSMSIRQDAPGMAQVIRRRS